MKVAIVYWSGTGNTQMIADALYQAIDDVEGIETTIAHVEEITASDISDSDVFFLGSPAMGVEEIETYEFRPFFEEIKPDLTGKTVFLFGSYDWGEGDWMELWKEEVEAIGARLFPETFVVNLTPTSEQLEPLHELAQQVLNY